MAEVLITLAIIGVVAALTIPTVVKNYQEQQFKTAYKKAYSDLSRVVTMGTVNAEFPYRTGVYDYSAGAKEIELLKKYFKVQKSCDRTNLFDCWKDADRVCTGACAGCSDNGCQSNKNGSKSFVDASGRNWITFYPEMNIYLVDTNGFKEPNKFGKDRWTFVFIDKDKKNVSKGYPVGVSPYKAWDYTSKDDWCTYPPCYYKKWLME